MKTSYLIPHIPKKKIQQPSPFSPLRLTFARLFPTLPNFISNSATRRSPRVPLASEPSHTRSGGTSGYGPAWSPKIFGLGRQAPIATHPPKYPGLGQSEEKAFLASRRQWGGRDCWPLVLKKKKNFHRIRSPNFCPNTQKMASFLNFYAQTRN